MFAMDIYVITPQDAALSALGLDLSQALMDFLFRQSHIGFLAFIVGFLFNVWRCTQSTNYRQLLMHAAIFVVCLVLITTPARQEGNIKSSWEVYAQTDDTKPLLNAQQLKSAQTKAQAMPVLLTFIGQVMDSFSIGSIAALSQLMPDYAQYLKYPFGIQGMALDLHTQMREGIQDFSLKARAQDFVYVHYLPALMLLRNTTSNLSNLSMYGACDEQITNNYSSNVKQEWDVLKADIKTNINVPSNFFWHQAKTMLDQAYSPSPSKTPDRDDDFINALMRREAQDLNDKHLPRPDWFWQAAHALLRSYPYAQGLGNFCLYVFFPIMLCLVLTLARFDFLFYYIKSFLWVKSWVLTAALAYWTSLFMFYAQMQTAGGVQWFWQQPYFALGAGILVYVMPVMIFFLLYRGVRFNTH